MISLQNNSLKLKGKTKNTGVVIPGFRRGVNEIFVLLGSYAAYSDNITDVSGQHIGSIFNGQAVRLDWTDGLSRNVGN